MEVESSSIYKAILKKKSIVQSNSEKEQHGLTAHYKCFQEYYKAIGIKIIWQWCKD